MASRSIHSKTTHKALSKVLGGMKPVNQSHLSGKVVNMSKSKKSTKQASETKTETAEKTTDKTESKKVLKVARKDAVAILTAYGFKETHKYTNELLLKRLGKLKTYMEGAEVTLDGNTQEKVDAILKAGIDFTVVGEEPENKRDTSVKSSGKRASGESKKSNKKSQPRVGVVSVIMECLAEGATIDDIHKKLTKKFPDRDSDGMRRTISSQISYLKSVKHVDMKKDEKTGVWKTPKGYVYGSK